jgi:MFS family permease
LVITLALCTIGSLMSAFSAGSPALLLAGRILQGLTGAVLPLSIGVVRENMPPRLMPMGVGLMMSGASLGTASGLVLGGLIVDNYAWRGIFVASAVFCFVTLIGILALVPRSPTNPGTGKTDWLAGILFAPGIIMLLYYCGSIAKRGLFDRTGLMILGGGIVLVAIWVWRSLKAEEPLIDIRLLGNRNVFVASAVSALVALSSLQIVLIFQGLLQNPRWTGAGLGVSATKAGLAKLPSNIFSTFAGPLAGWITGRGGGRVAMLAGGALASFGWILAWLMHDSFAQTVVILCVISFGTTILFTVGPTIVASTVPQERTSEVAGMLSVIRGIFSGIGAMIVTSLLAIDQIKDPASKALYPTAHAFQTMLLVVIGFSIVATLMALALPKGKGLETA